MADHELLGLSREEFEAVASDLVSRTFRGRPYRHLPDGRRSVETGTVLVGGTAARGFPKVPRTLVLETGVPARFDGPIAVEEKLNGYNVRIVRVDGETLAFTRSGIACPFTTAKVRALLDLGPFFDDHPEAMLCGEMIGPENPYTTHEYPDVGSLAFRAFDVRDRERGDPLSVEARRERCDGYGIPQAPLLAVVDPDAGTDRIADAVDDLDAAGREGVVMKSLDGEKHLKYTTSAANRGDLAYAFAYPFDYGRDFVFRRLVREAFRAVERGGSSTEVRERAHGVGEAILESMVDAVKTVRAGEEIGERHTVRGDPTAVEELLAHLREQGLRVRVDTDRFEGGDRVVTFTKVMRSSTDRTQAYLDGKIVDE